MNWKAKLKSLVTTEKPNTDTVISADNAVNIIADFVNLVENIQAQYNFNYEQVGRADEETQDLLHWVELINMDAIKGWKFIKDVKKVRVDRRYYKDQNIILEYVVNYIKTNNSSINNLKYALETIKTRQETLSNRVYQPRVRTDLDFNNKAV